MCSNNCIGSRCRRSDQFLQTRPPVRLDAVESYIRGLLAATPDQQPCFLSRVPRGSTRTIRSRASSSERYSGTARTTRSLPAGWSAWRSSDPHIIWKRSFSWVSAATIWPISTAPKSASGPFPRPCRLNEVLQRLGRRASRGSTNRSAALARTFARLWMATAQRPGLPFQRGLLRCGDRSSLRKRWRAFARCWSGIPPIRKPPTLLGRALQKRRAPAGRSQVRGPRTIEKQLRRNRRTANCRRNSASNYFLGGAAVDFFGRRRGLRGRRCGLGGRRWRRQPRARLVAVLMTVELGEILIEIRPCLG
jgi:hypothetical protein